ncbi:hypothetical protein ACWDAO_37995, partial [Streptomyces sp. NPDC001212]
GFAVLEAAGGFGLPCEVTRSYHLLVDTLITGRRRLAAPGRSFAARRRGGRTDTAAFTVPQHPGSQGVPVDAQVGGDVL